MIKKLLLGSALFTAACSLSVLWLVHMPLLPEVGDAALDGALLHVRRRLAGDAPPAIPVADAEQLDLPVILTVFRRGSVVGRGQGRGPSFGAAVTQALENLRSSYEFDPGDRLAIDRVRGRGFLSSNILPLLALGTVPVRDGVGARAGGRELVLTVHDLLAADVWAHYRPVPGGDFSIGMDGPKVLRLVDAGLAGERRERVYRVRAESRVEQQGVAKGSSPSRARLEAAARAAGAYLSRHLHGDGRFDYEYWVNGRGVPHGDDYSLARHAGAASFLAQLIALDQDPTIRAAAISAIDYLTTQRPRLCRGAGISIASPQAAVVDLGTSALSLIAALEFERTTGDLRYRPFSLGLADYLFSMQRDDGEFCHLYDCVRGKRDEKTSLMFFSGEAAYALALLAHRTDGPLATRAMRAVDRALGYLTERAYGHFAGQFFIGEEHWTCIALDAAWEGLPAESRERYARFCDEFARFSRRVQFLPGEAVSQAQPQLLGSYGAGAQVAAAATPVGSRSESLVAIERLARRRGLAADDPRVVAPHEQLLAGVEYLLRHQLDDGGDPLVADPDAARGGFLLSEVERRVRIDTVQHAGSALLGCLSLL